MITTLRILAKGSLGLEFHLTARATATCLVTLAGGFRCGKSETVSAGCSRTRSTRRRSGHG